MHLLRFTAWAALVLTIGAASVRAGVYLTSYQFSAADLPSIWSDDGLEEPYRLRAKIAGFYHATDLYNNQLTPLESVPAPGTYPIELYWVRYDADWSTVLEVGPFFTTTVTILPANQAPQTHTVSGTASSPGQPTTLSGRATDPNGNLQWLHFYTNDANWSGYVHAGSVSVGPTADATASVTWMIPSGGPTGTYQAHLRATDSNGVWDWNGGAVSYFAVRAAQPGVGSQHATVALGAAFSPVLTGGAGTGPWQWVIVGQTNWGGTQPGTLLPPTNTVAASWTASVAGTFDFYVIRQGDAHYLPSAIAGPYTLTVLGSPPTITTQPQSLAVTAGLPASLAVAATGGGPLSYQWRRNGVALPGATTATWQVAAAQPADAGSYTVVVSNAAGAVTSSAATLTVTVSPPAILLHPASQNASAGQNVSFHVSATGSPPLLFQWRKDGAALGGATNASLTLPDVQPVAAGSYSVVITNGAGTVTSNAASLTVALAPPVITAHPVSLATNVGQAATFSVAATGSAPLAYQWRRNGTPLPGATAATFTLASSQSSDAANSPGYTVVVSNSVGSVVSAPATLTVTTTPPVRLALQYWQPNDWPDHGTGNGDYRNEWVWVDGHNEEIGHWWDTDDDGWEDTWVVDGYQWVDGQWEWQSVWVEETAPDGLYGSRWDTTLGTFGLPTANDSSAYRPSATDRGFLLYSYPPDNGYVVFRVWAHAPAGNCSQFTYSVFTPGGGPTGNSGSIPPGGYADVWLPTGVWGAGAYRVDLSYAGATATANPAGTVSYRIALGLPLPPTLATPPAPASQTVNAGATVVYQVSSPDAASYQWQKDNTPLPGATTATLTLSGVSPSAGGLYRVVLGNSGGTTTSPAVALLVQPSATSDADGDGLPDGIEQLLASAPAIPGVNDQANTTLQLRIHLP